VYQAIIDRAKHVGFSGDEAKQEAMVRELIDLAGTAPSDGTRLTLAYALAQIPSNRSGSAMVEISGKCSDRVQRGINRARLHLAGNVMLPVGKRTLAIIELRKLRDDAKVPATREAAKKLLDQITAADPAPSETGDVTFRKHRLSLDSNEGCTVADVDRDGQLDVIAGPAWYKGPNFDARPLRTLPTTSEFTSNNGDHALDVNQDEWIDVISGDWGAKEVHWYENPGAEGLENKTLWKKHLLVDGRGQNEAYFLVDLDGDAVPEILVNCWEEKAPVVAWKLHRDGGKVTTTRHIIGENGCGHGMVIGDINADGRDDIVVGKGWYEAPATSPLVRPWKHHAGFELGHFSTPGLIVDVNRDGLADIVYGQGHDYGLAWQEQIKGDDGAIGWKHHLIDKSYSQAHTLAWADLDGDGHSELIAGKRVRGHGGNDPGAHEPTCLYRYVWDTGKNAFVRRTIAQDNGVSTGMQINVVDFNQDGALDIAVAGKTGTYVLINERKTGAKPE
jgi:hypothetical protein